jgi:glycosyltransferase 2 family protein
LRSAHPGHTADALAATNVVLLGPSLALLVAAFLLRAVRWWALFPAGSRPPLRIVTDALFVGYLGNAVLPLRGGEAAAVIALNRRAGTPVAQAAATMLVQRAQDVLSLVLLLFVMVPWLPEVTWLRAGGFAALALAAVLAAIAVAVLRYGDRPIRAVVRPLRLFPFVSVDAIERAPAEFVRGLVGIVSLRVAVVAFAWTTISWVVLGVGFWVVMEACALQLTPLAGLLVVIGIGLAMILPSSPAALGVFEGATVVVLSAYDVASSPAVSYALVLHALNIVPLFVVALGVLALRRLQRR